MGHNWEHSYNVSLQQSGTDIVLSDGAGRRDLYRLQPDGTYVRAEFFRKIQLEQDGSLSVYFENQGKWNFFPFIGDPVDGRLRRLSDRNGNMLQFQYDATGYLTNVIDTLNRSIAFGYDANGFLQSVTDFTGRQVTYTYYGTNDVNGSFGDLKSVTTPAITVAAPGNTFPNGRTTVYTYTRGNADDQLNHNLLTITDAKGQTYVQNVYASTTNAASPFYDRVIQQTLGNPGEAMHFVYVPLVASAANNFAVMQTILNDRVGNVSEHFFDSRNRLVMRREFTGRADPAQPVTAVGNRPVNPLRPSDPVYFEWRYSYNNDAMVTQELRPNGNFIQYVYEGDLNPGADAESRGNLRFRRFFPGAHLPAGDQTMTEEQFDYASGLGGCGCNFNFVTRYQDGRGNQVFHSYDQFGNRTNTTERVAGVAHDYQYNQFGQMTLHLWPDNGSGSRRRDDFSYYTNGVQLGYLRDQTIDAANLKLKTTYDYDALGRPAAVTDPRGHTTSTVYNEVDEVVRVTAHEVTDGSNLRYTVEYSYDANGNQTRKDVYNFDDVGAVAANPAFTTAFQYDILNVLIRATSEVDTNKTIAVDYVYDANRNLILTRSGEATSGRQPDNVVRMLHDERNKVFQITRAPGSAAQSTDQFDYDLNGNVARIANGIEAAPRVSSFVYDGFDRVVAAIDPMGNVVRNNYDADGNKVYVTREGELVDLPGSTNNVMLAGTGYTYDAMNRVVRSDASFFDTTSGAQIGDGQVTTLTAYSANSQVLSVANDNGHVARMVYDTANRLAQNIDAKGNTVSYVYDLASNPIQIIEVDKSDLGAPDEVFISTNRYDNLDRLTSVSDNIGNTRTFFRDSRNNVIREIDARGNVTRRAYDGLSRLVATDYVLTSTGDGSGAVVGTIQTSQTWDDNSRLTSQTDDNNHATSYAFDALNRLVATTYADGTAQTIAYDVHNNPVSWQDANGTRAACAYDLLDRSVRCDYAAGNGVATSTTFEVFAYDGLSRVVSAQNDLSTVTRSYNSLSAVVSETLNGKTSRWIYDGLGNQQAAFYPSGRIVTNSFDQLERLKTVADQIGLIANYSYQGMGRVERKAMGNNTRADFAFDGIRRTTRIAHSKAPYLAANQFENLALSWSPTSQKTSRNRQIAGGEKRAFGYDSIDRLIHSVQTPAVGAIQAIDYALDGVGNRTTVTGGPDAGTYTQNSSAPGPNDAAVNQYTLTPQGNRLYDENGNLLLIAAGPRNLSYDVHNRMVGFVSGITNATYRYDAFGRRVEKIVQVSPPAGSGGQATTATVRFLYDGWRIIEERDATDAPVATYAYGNYIDEPLTMDRGGQRYFYHSDDLFSVTRLTDAAGAVVENYDYADYGASTITDPNGIVIGSTGVKNQYQFVGRYQDEESGLLDYRTRYYDPKAGRFATRDTTGTWGDSANAGNAFTYVSSSPYSKVDPLGLDGEGGGIVSGVVSGAKGVYNSLPSGVKSGAGKLMPMVGIGTGVYLTGTGINQMTQGHGGEGTVNTVVGVTKVGIGGATLSTWGAAGMAEAGGLVVTAPVGIVTGASLEFARRNIIHGIKGEPFVGEVKALQDAASSDARRKDWNEFVRKYDDPRTITYREQDLRQLEWIYQIKDAKEQAAALKAYMKHRNGGDTTCPTGSQPFGHMKPFIGRL